MTPTARTTTLSLNSYLHAHALMHVNRTFAATTDVPLFRSSSLSGGLPCWLIFNKQQQAALSSCIYRFTRACVAANGGDERHRPRASTFASTPRPDHPVHYTPLARSLFTSLCFAVPLKLRRFLPTVRDAARYFGCHHFW